MGVALDLLAQEPVSERISILKDLNVARTSLIKERTRLKSRAHTITLALLKRQSKARLRRVECQIEELDTEISAHVAQEAPKARNRNFLCSFPGLAPFSRQSGKWLGKSPTQGGRNPPRDALYRGLLPEGAGSYHKAHWRWRFMISSTVFLLIARSRAIQRYVRTSATAVVTFSASLSATGRWPG